MGSTISFAIGSDPFAGTCVSPFRRANAVVSMGAGESDCNVVCCASHMLGAVVTGAIVNAGD